MTDYVNFRQLSLNRTFMKACTRRWKDRMTAVTYLADHVLRIGINCTIPGSCQGADLCNLNDLHPVLVSE